MEAAVSGDQSNLLGWILAGVSAVIATLSTVLAKFYHHQLSMFHKREKSLETRIDKLEEYSRNQRAEIIDCHKQREEMRVELVGIKTELKFVSQRLGEKCPVIAPPKDEAHGS